MGLSLVAVVRHIAWVIPVFFLIWIGCVVFMSLKVRSAERNRAATGLWAGSGRGR